MPPRQPLRQSPYPPNVFPPPSWKAVEPLDTEAQTLLQGVRSALADRAGKDVFAIGGNITDRPVTIRWNRGGEWNQGRTLSLPTSNDDETSARAFDQLLADCQPATFGRGEEEVLDEGYRKAGKLDNADFCTNFNPSARRSSSRISNRPRNPPSGAGLGAGLGATC